MEALVEWAKTGDCIDIECLEIYHLKKEKKRRRRRQEEVQEEVDKKKKSK